MSRSIRGDLVFDRRTSGPPRISVVAAARPNFMKVGPADPGAAGARGRGGAGPHRPALRREDVRRCSSGTSASRSPTSTSRSARARTRSRPPGCSCAFERYLLEQRHRRRRGRRRRQLDPGLRAGRREAATSRSPTSRPGCAASTGAMPEEINRVADRPRSRDLLFATAADAATTTSRAEGVRTRRRVHLVGNVMIDTLLANLDRARERADGQAVGLGLGRRYGVVTLHRPSNVDEAAALQALVDAHRDRSTHDLDVVFPAHPRTPRAGRVRRDAAVGHRPRSSRWATSTSSAWSTARASS